VIARPFGIVETDQLLWTRQSVVDPLSVPRQRIVLGPGQQRRTADLANHLLEAVILRDLQLLGQGVDHMHPEGSLNDASEALGSPRCAPRGSNTSGPTSGNLSSASFGRAEKRAFTASSRSHKPGVCNARGQAVLRARRTRREVAAKTPAHQRNSLGVGFRAGQGVVHDRPNDVLPVGPHHEALLDQRPALPRAIQEQQVVPTAKCGREVEVHIS
jgi:hypothetical protein